MLAPNKRHQKLPMYPELGIYRERKLLQLVERLGTVRPAGARTGGGCPAVLSPHLFSNHLPFIGKHELLVATHRTSHHKAGRLIS